MISRKQTRILSWVWLSYFILTIYWELHYIGPSKFLGEVQIAMFGSHWTALSFAILNLPVTIVYLVIQKRIRGGSRSSIQPKSLGDALADNLFNNPVLQDLTPSIVILVVTMWIFSIIGGQAFSPDLGQVRLGDIEAGKIHQNTYYAQVSGYSDDKVISRKKGSAYAFIYISIREEPDPQSPVYLVVASQENEIEKYITTDRSNKRLTTSGYVSDGLPGEVKSRIEKDGIKLANNVKMITPRINRSSAKNWSIGMLIGGVSISIFSFLQRRRHRQNSL